MTLKQRQLEMEREEERCKVMEQREVCVSWLWPLTLAF